MNKTIVKILATFFAVAVISGPVYAKVDGIVVKDKITSKLYEYEYEKLIYEAENNAVGIDSNFYNEYSSKNNKVEAFHDDVKGYINYDMIERAAEDALILGKKFELQNFIDSTNEEAKYIPNDNIQVRILRNNNVVNGEVIQVDNQHLGFDVVRIY